MRVSDYIMSRLVSASVENVYTVTGRGILYLTDALAKESRLNCICNHHEQGCGFAAMAEAMYTGHPGAVLVSTGCGASNAITSLLCAYQDSVPMIYISGNNHLAETTYHTGLNIRTYGSQETNIVEVVKPLCKYAVMLEDAKSVVLEMEKLMYYMNSGRKGTVWLDVPLDIQNARLEDDEIELLLTEAASEIEKIKEKEGEYNPEISSVLEALKQAKRPVFIIGSGIRLADAVEEFRLLADRLTIPVVLAPSAADIYGTANAYSVGTVGALGGTREGNICMQNCDLLISIGCSLPSLITGENPDTFTRDAKRIVVDIDRVQHEKKGPEIHKFIYCDAKLFVTELNKAIDDNFVLTLKGNIAQWSDKVQCYKRELPLANEDYDKSGRVDLYDLAGQLSKVLPEDGVLISDAGFEELIIPSATVLKNGQRLIHPAAQGSMGFALPAGIGAAIACNHQVFVVVGDGSVMMNLQELQTIAASNMPVKIIITNNDMYSVIDRRQQDLFRTRTIGTRPENGVTAPEFKKVAECFGLNYIKAENSGELMDKLEELKNQQGPSILEVMCQEKQRYLHQSFGKNMKGRVARKPLEDLSPFMDREKFLECMIIEPVEA